MDLNNSLPVCPRPTVSLSCDQPLLLAEFSNDNQNSGISQWGRGMAIQFAGSPMPGSASDVQALEHGFTQC